MDVTQAEDDDRPCRHCGEKPADCKCKPKPKQGELNFEANYYRTGLPSVPSDTSEGAADSIGNVARLRAKAYRFIEGREDGATCDEVEAGLGMIHQTCSPRVRELVLGHFIEDSGERRPTRRGRSARVYKVMPAR